MSTLEDFSGAVRSLNEIKVVTLHLRPRVRNPWPKLYVTMREHREYVLKGLPCAIVMDGSEMAAGHRGMIGRMVVDEVHCRGIKRFHKADLESNSEFPSVSEILHDAFQGVDMEELCFIVPILQTYMKWKNVRIPEALRLVEAVPALAVEGLVVSDDGTGAVANKINTTSGAAFVVHEPEKGVKGRKATYLKDSGPPLKIPNGDILSSCCMACTNNFLNFQGGCHFGDDVCIQSIEIPGKSKLLENLAEFVKLDREFSAQNPVDLKSLASGAAKKEKE